MQQNLDIQLSRKVIDAAIAYIAFEMKKAIKTAVSDMTPELIKGMDMRRNTEMQARALASISQQLEKLTGKEDPKELSAILSAIQHLKMPDMKPMEMCMKEMMKKESDMTGMKELLIEMNKTLKGMQFPDTMKLDEMQVRALTNSGRGIAVTGGVLAARSATVTNTNLTSANNEYPYTFPANTVSYIIKLRAPNVTLLYSWTTGKLPTSGDGLAYMTSPQGFIRGQNDLDVSGKTIYLQTASASQLAEIEVFKAT